VTDMKLSKLLKCEYARSTIDKQINKEMKLKSKTNKAKASTEKGASVPAAGSNAMNSLATKLTSSLPSWAEKDPAKMRKIVASFTAPKVFAPEIKFGDNETKSLRFLTDSPLIQYFRYRLRIGTRWMSFTQPPSGVRDLFAEEGHSPSFVALYLAYDEVGFTRKDGTKGGPRLGFYLASGKLFRQLELLSERRGGISGYNIEITRIGMDQTTTYQLIPEAPTPLAASVLKLDNPANKLDEFYAPLSPEEQAEVLGVDL